MTELSADSQASEWSAIVLERFAQAHAAQFCNQLIAQRPEQILDVCSRLTAPVAANVLALLPSDLSAKVFSLAQPEQLIKWVRSAEPDAAVSIVSRLPLSVRSRLQHAAPRDRLLRQRLDRSTARPLGALLRSDFLTVSADATQLDLVQNLRRTGAGRMRAIFVCDSNGRYRGIIHANRALVADGQASAVTLMHWVNPVQMSATIEQASGLPQRRSHRELPVVDTKQRLVGSLNWGELTSMASRNRYDWRDQALPTLSPSYLLEVAVAAMTTLLDLLVFPKSRS